MLVLDIYWPPFAQLPTYLLFILVWATPHMAKRSSPMSKEEGRGALSQRLVLQQTLETCVSLGMSAEILLGTLRFHIS